MKNSKDPRSDCPLSGWLEIFGDRWTMIIIRDIAFLGKKNFKEFMLSPEGIASNILSARLALLVRHAVVEKSRDENNKLIFNYTLTPKGKDLEPIAKAILGWSEKYLSGTKKITM